MFWQHEFLNNARNINASLTMRAWMEAMERPSTSKPRIRIATASSPEPASRRHGVTAQFGKNLSGSVFYNVNFGSQTYQSNMVSVGLNVAF
jgi:outer membrane autotransporter protein